jgi:hypothetical protein
MKTVLIVITTSRMKNEIHAQFYESVNSLIVKISQEALEAYGLAVLYLLFKQAFDNETAALDVIVSSGMSPQIVEYDRSRDSIFRGFSDVVKGFRNHFDPEMREAANKLWKIFLHYGNVTRKQLDAETAAINDILREMNRTENAAAMEKLQVNEWAVKLAEENDRFQSAMMERYSELKGNTVYRMRQARLETDRFYRAMAAQIENNVLTGIMNADDDFIMQWNSVVTRFKNILAQQFGQNQKKSEL